MKVVEEEPVMSKIRNSQRNDSELGQLIAYCNRLGASLQHKD